MATFLYTLRGSFIFQCLIAIDLLSLVLHKHVLYFCVDLRDIWSLHSGINCKAFNKCDCCIIFYWKHLHGYNAPYQVGISNTEMSKILSVTLSHCTIQLRQCAVPVYEYCFSLCNILSSPIKHCLYFCNPLSRSSKRSLFFI